MKPLLFEIMVLAHKSQPSAIERCRLLGLLEMLKRESDASEPDQDEPIDVQAYVI